MDLIKKLRLKTDQPLLMLNAPEECAGLFESFDIIKNSGKAKPLPQIIIFSDSSTSLLHELNRLEGHIGHDTLLWLCYPKKASGIKTDLGVMDSWKMVFDIGYRGQTAAAINEHWAGLRVTNAPRDKPSDADIPMTERETKGIDYVSRTVELPADALKAVRVHKGMEAFFYGQSFTCKKEYLIAITDAKKEDTRKRRIDQMVTAMEEKMRAKELKQAGKK